MKRMTLSFVSLAVATLLASVLTTPLYAQSSNASMLTNFWMNSSATAKVDAHYKWNTVASATPDECFYGNANNGLTPTQVLENQLSFNSHYPAGLAPADIAACIAAGGTPKVNQAYVWGLTHSGDNIWFSTVANTLCIVLDTFYGTVPPPFQTNSWVCDSQDGEDFKPPRMFVYGIGKQSLVELTPQVLASSSADAALLTHTVGLRSAGHHGGVVFFGGIVSTTSIIGATPVVLFAFRESDQKYLGSYVFDGQNDRSLYTDIRQWHNIDSNLFVGVGKPGGGELLRWNGSVTAPFAFVSVAQFLGDPAYFTGHKGRIYVSTWGSHGQIYGMSLYMSPALHDSTGLTPADSTNWSEIWNLNQYEVEPTAIQVGGAIASFGDYLYFGTMHVPGTGLVAFETAYPNATVNTADVLGSYRPIAIFRTKGGATPKVDLLYGSPVLPQYNAGTDSWSLVPNGLGEAPAYGLSGFNNFFNNYTWSMAVYNDQLFVGTMDWSYLAADGIQALAGVPQQIVDLAQPFYGADLWRFPSTHDAAVPVSIDGMGNYLSYGVRNMIVKDDKLWIGMANPMNLRTDPNNPPLGGWKLIELQPK